MNARIASHWLLTMTLFVSTILLFVRVNQLERQRRASEVEIIKVFKRMSDYTHNQTRYISNLHKRIDALEEALLIE